MFRINSKNLLFVVALSGMPFSANAQQEEMEEVIKNKSNVFQTVPEMEERPLWEFGAGGISFYRPDYPGSNESRFRGFPFPYFIYRGDVLRFGEGGAASAVAIENDLVEFGLSINGAFNVSAEDNKARIGMSDLDFLFEVGVKLVLHAQDFEYASGAEGAIDLVVKTRAVFSTDFSSVEDRGYVFEPEIRYTHRGLFGNDDASMNFSLSSVFATEKLQDYFYEVEPQFATSTRSEFNAQSGYMGTTLGYGLSFDINDNIRVFAAGGLGYYGGAKNKNSPLLNSDFDVSVAFGLTYILHQSDTMVLRRRE